MVGLVGVPVGIGGLGDCVVDIGGLGVGFVGVGNVPSTEEDRSSIK